MAGARCSCGFTEANGADETIVDHLLWVFTPEAKHLGTIKLPEQPANCAWGDDWKTLYITAETGLYRVKTNVTGQKMVYA